MTLRDLYFLLIRPIPYAEVASFMAPASDVHAKIGFPVVDVSDHLGLCTPARGCLHDRVVILSRFFRFLFHPRSYILRSYRMVNDIFLVELW